MNILIIRFSSMGDVILASAVIAYCRSRWTDARLWFCTDSAYAGLFQDDDRLTRVVHCAKKNEPRLAHELADVHFDRIIDLQNNGRSRALLHALGQSAPVGKLDKKHFKRLLLLALRLNTFRAADTVVRRYCQAAGAKNNECSQASIILKNSSLPQAAKNITGSGAPLLALLPFSAWKNKQWPIDFFIAVGSHFVKNGFRVAILGSSAEATQAQRMAAQIGSMAESLAGKLSLYECAMVLQRSALALGNDSGLTHLARAVGVATGFVYGATTRHLGFFPHGEEGFAVFEQGLWCRPCHAHGGNVCFRMNRPCLHRIAPQTVIKGLQALLALKAK